MLLCPNCSSLDVYVHDRGWTWVWRMITFNSRLVCRDCRTTWKRRHPEQFSKIKRKSRHRRRRVEGAVYKIKNGNEVLSLKSPDKRTQLIGKWQEENNIFICLDFKGTAELSTQELGNLMDFYRKLKAIGGNMIIVDAPAPINDCLWSLNLSHLLASDQEIVP